VLDPAGIPSQALQNLGDHYPCEHKGSASLIIRAQLISGAPGAELKKSIHTELSTGSTALPPHRFQVTLPDPRFHNGEGGLSGSPSAPAAPAALSTISRFVLSRVSLRALRTKLSSITMFVLPILQAYTIPRNMVYASMSVRRMRVPHHCAFVSCKGGDFSSPFSDFNFPISIFSCIVVAGSFQTVNLSTVKLTSRHLLITVFT